MKRFKYLIAKIWRSNTITTWGVFSIKFIYLLTVTPLLISKLSPQETTIWFLFLLVISLTQLADVGFSPTFIRVVAFVMGGATQINDFRKKNKEKLGEPNWKLMEKLFGNINLVYFILTILAFVLISSLGTLSIRKPLAEIKNNEFIWYSWLIICIGTTLNFYGRKYKAILQGMNYVALINRWEILFGILSVIVSVAVLLFGGGLLALAITHQFFLILSSLRGWFLLRYVEHGRFKKFNFLNYDKRIFYGVWSPSWRSGLGILASTGIVQATGIIYSQYGQTVDILAYLIALRVMTNIAEISKAPFYSQIQIFAKLRAQGKLSELISKAGRSMMISLTVFTFGILISGLMMNRLLSLINHEVRFIPITLWAFMSIVWYIERHHAMHAQIYSTTNHIPFYVPIIITGFINIFLIVLLIEQLGFWVFPIAQGISNITINNWWNVVISLKSMDIKFLIFSKKYILLPTLFMVGAIFFMLII